MLLQIILASIILISLLVILYLIKRSRKFDGYIVVMQKEDGTKVFSLELKKEPEDLETMKHVVFKVVIDPIDLME